MIERDNIIPAELIAHLKMNDNAPNTLVVNSGTFPGDSMLVSNIKTTEDISDVGKINSALRLGDADDHIDLKITPYSTFQKPFNISVWVSSTKGPSTTSYQRVFLFSATDSHISLDIDGDGHVSSTYRSENNVTTWKSSDVLFPDNIPAWRHLSVNVTESFIEFYFNGTTIDNNGQDGNMSGIDMSKFGSNDGAGYVGYTDGDGLDGLVDDFRLYDRALSSFEILQIYNNGNGTED